MSDDKLYFYLDEGIEIILTGDIIPIAKDLDFIGVGDKDCINIYVDSGDQELTYILHRKKRLIKYMKDVSFMDNRKYILINLLTKDRLKLQAMMSLGFSFADSLYEIHIKDKEPIIHSYR